MGWSSTGIEVYYTPSSAHSRALLMCIKDSDGSVNGIWFLGFGSTNQEMGWTVKTNLAS